jgi:2-C-methyl-D-erythritol 4-phosphate cytidylyltransferase
VSWAAVVVAAGRGERFGRPKQLVELVERPVLAWCLETFASMREVEQLVVTTEPELIARVQRLARTIAPTLPSSVIAGGAERQDSVRLALECLAENASAELNVFVHDGARPMIRADDVRRGMQPVAPGVGALLAVRVVDTIKRVGEDGKVRATLDRSQLWAAQTPQFGTLTDLLRAHREAEQKGVRVTDDASLLELAGVDVVAVEGKPENFKITVPADLARAELILRERMVV